MKDFKIKLLERKLICENTYQLTFDTSGIDYDFFPGQYANFKLMYNADEDMKGNVRPFSFAGSPSNNELMIAVRKNESVFIENLLRLEVGSEVIISEPMGNNILDDKNEKVFIAGGIGITPVRCILEYLSENNLNEKITLFYFNRDCSQTAFLDEFKKWDEEMDSFNFIPVVEDEKDVHWKGETGLFNEYLLRKYLKNIEDKNFYLFGSDQMDKYVKQILFKSDVKNENIITEKSV
ncbi:MAG: FAD-dependent oxidoreductase [Ignavibacteria bacterium]